LNNWLSIYT